MNSIVPVPRMPGAVVYENPDMWAKQLGISTEACQLVATSDFIDLHVTVEVPARLYGYDPAHRHAVSHTTPRFFGHTDFPKLKEAGLTGIVYDIATNPFRFPAERQRVTLKNLDRVRQRMAAWPSDLAWVRTGSEYDTAKALGQLALFLNLQGGNAFLHDPSVLSGPIGQDLHRITLVHLTSSGLGGTNSPFGFDRGLRHRGREFVERCHQARILVDLSHAGKRTFWDTLQMTAPELPVVVSHTGVEGVRPIWRNIDDKQLRAIADRGGVIGIIFQSNFLEPVWLGTRGTRRAILDHLQHVIDVVGEDFAAMGSDYDGMIVPPADLPDVTLLPWLVQDMLDRRWSSERIIKILGLNYLRVIRSLRP